MKKSQICLSYDFFFVSLQHNYHYSAFMKRFLLAIICLFSLFLPMLAIEDGQYVRLVNGGKTLSVQDSKLDVNANAVLWTETNTNSQRWR